jgi:RNA polymerase sigma factor (sigma-70 family)
MPSDLQHLQRYATTGDAHAFRELVQAHGAMVHATALRVTRDAAAAQDVAQETFLELARKAGSITQSVAAWLHRVAWNRACDAVRRESTRKRVEEAMAETWHTDREATWPDIEPNVDASLNELPNELREVLVLYFLEGRTQAEVARHLGKNQATVSRAIERGISGMREALRSRGVIAGAGLAALFAAQSAQAMPVAVQASLGKLSLTGIGTSSAIPAASVTTTLITMTATTKALLVTGTLAAVSLPFVLPRTENKPTPVSPPSVTKTIATNPISRSNASEMNDDEVFNLLFGGDLDRSKHARSLVEDYRAAHLGLSLIELAKEPSLTAKLQPLMQAMMTQPELGKQFIESMQLAMKVKGINPSPSSNVSLNMGEGFLSNESQAERYLGAVLANDAKALAQLFADVVTEAAIEMTFDPSANTTSNGVSISKGPLPPGAKVIQPEPEY